MHVAPDDLAEFERLLAKLREVQVPAGDVDLPAAEYARNFYVTVTVLVYTVVSNIIASFTAGLLGNISQIVDLVFPLGWTLSFGLVLGTLDSAAAGRRAVHFFRCCFGFWLICIVLLHWTEGLYAYAVAYGLATAIMGIYYPWILTNARQIICLRYRGSLTKQAQHYTNRALRIAGFQIVLAVSTVAQGINGAESYPRVNATFAFSLVLPQAWLNLVIVFDACGVDASAAAKLRLSPLQTAALAACGTNILSGLTAYVVAEQRRPPKRAATAAVDKMIISNFLCCVFVGRLVWVARRTGTDSTAVRPAAEVDAGFDLPGT